MEYSMDHTLEAMSVWLAGSAFRSTCVLTLGVASMVLVRAGAKRQRIGEWTLLTSLAVCLLAPVWPFSIVSVPVIRGPGARPLARQDAGAVRPASDVLAASGSAGPGLRSPDFKAA